MNSKVIRKTLNLRLTQIILFVILTVASFALIDPHLYAQNATSCLVYAINDLGASRSQFLTVDLYNFNNVQPLGGIIDSSVIEGLDIHPLTDEMYTAGRYSTYSKDSLFKVNPTNGDLTYIGPLGFNNIEGLAFRPSDNTLWAWQAHKGLVQIDITTGKGTKSFQTPTNIQGIAWSNDSQVLYAAGGSDLWQLDLNAGTFVQLASNLPQGNIEGLDMRPDNHLMISADSGSGLEVFAYDTTQLKIVEIYKTNDKNYKDIEAIVWPDSCIIPPVDPSVTPIITPVISPPTTVTPPPSSPNNWLMTLNGNMHIGGISQGSPQSIPVTNLAYYTKHLPAQGQIYLSSYVYSQSSDTNFPTKSSQTSYSLNAYQDLNSKSPTGENWAKFLGDQLIGYSTNTEIININLIQDPDLSQPSQTSDILTSDPTKINVLVLSQPTDWNITLCNNKTIIYAKSDLNINDVIDIDGAENGCLFLVDGTLTLTEANKARSSATKTEYDVYKAFFIAQTFIAENDIDGLNVIGGIVANEVQLLRNHPQSRNQAFPTELLEFDSRYLYIYEDLVNIPFQTKISEPQFLQSLING